MKPIIVAAAVLNQTPLDWTGNLGNLLAAIEEARNLGAKVLCLPELAISGYGCEDAFHAPFVTDTSRQMLLELAPHTHGMAVAVGLPVRHHRSVYNCVAMLVDGKLRGMVAKRFLAGDGIHYEPRWFRPWPAGVCGRLNWDQDSCPIGDLVFDLGGIRIGFEICEDAWVADRPGSDLALREVDLILNPSASHFAFAKIAVRERFVLEGSRAFGVGYLYANLMGNESGRAIFDGGALIAASGKVLARGPRFSYADVKVTASMLDIELLRTERVRTCSHRPNLQELNRGVVEVPFTEWHPPGKGFTPMPSSEPAWMLSKEEEFTFAVSLALFDYLRKSHAAGFVVSLSGGADSAAVALLCACALRLAQNELGAEGLEKKLPQRVFGDLNPHPLVMSHWLTCVYQSTQNSSVTTLDAARSLAEAIGAEFMVLNVDPLVSAYTEMVELAIGRNLSWASDDLALQNIQARTRAPGVWMIANLKQALLLATSNRSEAAVGYATMDGDTCGGLSPIAGIDKAFLRHWLQWMELNGPDGIGPTPSLVFINRQRPTAELRPSEKKQTDEDDLMPYEVLDAVERHAIRDKRSPLEALDLLRKQFPEYEVSTLKGWVLKFFRLWSQNQWKRERYAPSFHLDDENLDPKTWCRFPILSGGFKRELEALNTMDPHE
jgi:NAD+ synthase (glutamine-hydrolysing)